jgi:carboxylate-amine ligase
MRSHDECRRVREQIGRLVLKTRDGYGGTGVFIGPDLDELGLRRVAQLVAERPEAFIAQETLDFSQHVILDAREARLEPRYIDLRVYAVQDGAGRISVFPGGLTRVSKAGDRVTNNSSGGLCKETWVVR